MKHTTGPWKVHEWETTVGTDFYHIRSEQRHTDLIATIHRWQRHINKKEALANAKLIAAAPDMFEVLISANNYFIDLQNKCVLTNSDERAWKLISKAIKKATE